MRSLIEFRYDNAREGMDRKRARFDDAVAQDRIPGAEDRTKTCKQCREYQVRQSEKSTPSTQRLSECEAYYRSQLTACDCGESRQACLALYKSGDAAKEVKSLSTFNYWSAAFRGVEKMKEARHNFTLHCRFCFSAFHSTRELDKTDFDVWLDSRMMTSCAVCDRVATTDTLRGFQFAHDDSTMKTVHPTLGALDMYTLRRGVREGKLDPKEAMELATAELPRGRVLCHNCHKLETDARGKRTPR